MMIASRAIPCAFPTTFTRMIHTTMPLYEETKATEEAKPAEEAAPKQELSVEEQLAALKEQLEANEKEVCFIIKYNL